jgi:VanZ family protein
MKKPPLEYLWPPLIIVLVFFASGRSHIAAPDFGFSLDKIAHFAVFGALATSIIRLRHFYESGWRGALKVWILVAIYGALDEYRQSFTPGRSVEFDDWLADILGSAVAVTLYLAWPWYHSLLESKPKDVLRKKLTNTHN